MKHTFLIAIASLGLFATSCNRHEAMDPGANSVKTYVTNPGITHNAGRLVPAGYSKPISVDTANRMIGSYLESVGYPYVDTTIRSLAFDADTLRAYLQNPSITTVKFYLSHQISWLDGGASRYGKNIGMSPGKLTVICVGLDDNGAVIRNTSNGVYEHAMPCPSACGPASSDAYLQ